MTLLRKYSYASPWNSLVPDLVMNDMNAPPVNPYSAETLFTTRNSPMSSTEGGLCATPPTAELYSAGTPSITIWLYIPTPPMMLFWKPAFETPGMAAKYPYKLRLPPSTCKGRFASEVLSKSEPYAELRSSIRGASAFTSIFSLTLPGLRIMSARTAALEVRTTPSITPRTKPVFETDTVYSPSGSPVKLYVPLLF